MGVVSELTMKAEYGRLDEVMGFVDGLLEKFGCPEYVQLQIELAVEELYLNIASYAYYPGTGNATIRVENRKRPARHVIITFIDSGAPYDPLARQDPDLDVEVEDRKVGGLGIFMVRSCMDDIKYEYKNGQNRLTIRKNLKEQGQAP